MAIFRRKNELNFSEFLDQVQKMRVTQANYQPVTICHLVNAENFTDSKIGIQEKLAVKNGLKKDDFKTFSNCPVFKVLAGKNMIEKIGDSYRLGIKLNESQKAEVLKICMELLRK